MDCSYLRIHYIVLDGGKFVLVEGIEPTTSACVQVNLVYFITHFLAILVVSGLAILVAI